MKSYFEQMFLYEHWANSKIFAYLLKQPDNTQLLPIFNHLVADALPWLHLLRDKTVPDSLIEIIQNSAQWTLEECQEQLMALHNGTDQFLDSLTEADMNRIVSSPGPHGQQFSNTVAEVLTHLLSHGQHHRGQIEWLVEQETGTYLATSLMPYLRLGGKL